MAKSHPLDGLRNWFGRDQWSYHADAVFDEFFTDILSNYDISFEDVSSVLGDAELTAAWGCYFEAAVTQPCEDADEGSILAEYLKRRGWKETASNRRYIKGLGDSVLSIHEVMEVTPGQSLVLKDRLLGGEPQLIVERSATKSLSVGEFLAARVVDEGPNLGLAGGLLRLSPATAEVVISNVGDAFHTLESALADGGDLADLAAEADLDLAKRIVLETQTPSVVQLWLDEQLSRRIEKLPPPSLSDDGEPLLFVELAYSVADVEQVRERLGTARFLLEADDDSWYWLDEQDVTEDRLGMFAAGGRKRERFFVELEDGTTVLGRLELADGRLIVAVNSQRRAERVQLLLGPLLSGLVGPVSTKARSLAQLLSDEEMEAGDVQGKRRLAS